MRQKDLDVWLNDAVTREVLDLIREHRKASSDIITTTMLNVVSLKDIDITKLAEYRGQVFAFDRVLDITDFLDEKIERQLNENDTARTQLDY